MARTRGEGWIPQTSKTLFSRRTTVHTQRRSSACTNRAVCCNNYQVQHERATYFPQRLADGRLDHAHDSPSSLSQVGCAPPRLRGAALNSRTESPLRWHGVVLRPQRGRDPVVLLFSQPFRVKTTAVRGITPKGNPSANDGVRLGVGRRCMSPPLSKKNVIVTRGRLVVGLMRAMRWFR